MHATGILYNPRVAVLAVFFLCIFARAQQPGEVRGVVLDAQGGEPLARVQVRLAGTPQQTVTGPDGRFSLAAVEPGGHVLHVSTVGYRLLTRPFRLDAGEVKEFEVVLTPDTLRRV